MILEQKKNYLYLLIANNTRGTMLVAKLDVLKKEPKNIIIEINLKLINKKSLILSLVKYSSFWKKRNKSFILVVQESSFSLFKDVVCIPTLNEAIDYLYMEELERNV